MQIFHLHHKKIIIIIKILKKQISECFKVNFRDCDIIKKKKKLFNQIKCVNKVNL